MGTFLTKLRKEASCPLSILFKQFPNIQLEAKNSSKIANPEIKKLFPHISKKELLQFQISNTNTLSSDPLRVGVVFSGGQASGGHNVIAGLYDALQVINPNSKLVGFLDGPIGIIKNRSIDLNADTIAPFRNQGGFDLLASGRDKIETKEDLTQSMKTVQENQLDGLVIIGGDDSNTNAAVLAEYFIENGVDCSVVGVPKTIDGDLQNEYVSISFGFDTACKTYAEIIGNIARDSLSAKKYYFFIKLMGRSASHIALETAMQTHPNLTLIGEEIHANKTTLQEVVFEIADLITKRAERNKNYGVILIPEGVIEFIPEFRELIAELNQLSFPNEGVDAFLEDKLSSESYKCWKVLTPLIQQQLLMTRDPHGNVQVSKIETERFLIDLVTEELIKRKKEGNYSGKFSAQPLFCGYEGRAALPSHFDSNYCYHLGFVAASLIGNKQTGYMACVNNLSMPVDSWEGMGVPLAPEMHLELRHGKEKPVIKKALVDIKSQLFLDFKNLRKSWAIDDDYKYPGSIQLFGPSELINAVTFTVNIG